LDTDIPPPTALAAVDLDLATREISKLLLEIQSVQPLVSEAAQLEPGPELRNGETLTGMVMPLHLQTRHNLSSRLAC